MRTQELFTSQHVHVEFEGDHAKAREQLRREPIEQALRILRSQHDLDLHVRQLLDLTCPLIVRACALHGKV